MTDGKIVIPTTNRDKVIFLIDKMGYDEFLITMNISERTTMRIRSGKPVKEQTITLLNRLFLQYGGKMIDEDEIKRAIILGQ